MAYLRFSRSLFINGQLPYIYYVYCYRVSRGRIVAAPVWYCASHNSLRAAAPLLPWRINSKKNRSPLSVRPSITFMRPFPTKMERPVYRAIFASYPRPTCPPSWLIIFIAPLKTCQLIFDHFNIYRVLVIFRFFWSFDTNTHE